MLNNSTIKIEYRKTLFDVLEDLTQFEPHKFHMINSPPGTGKTYAAVNKLAELSPKKRLLYLIDTIAGRDGIEEDYKNKVFNLCFDENGKVDERIKSYLDNAKFDIETASKEKKQMTIKEAVQSSILRTYDIDMNLYHATFTKEVGQQIIENGFERHRLYV